MKGRLKYGSRHSCTESNWMWQLDLRKEDHSQEVAVGKYEFLDKRIEQGAAKAAEPLWKLIITFGTVLLLFSTGVGFFWIVLMARDGDGGPNKYGNDPKGLNSQ